MNDYFSEYRKSRIVCWILLIILAGCNISHTDIDLQEYLKSYNKWKQDRITSLKSADGWLNLAGLYWLEEGENSFGSDSSNLLIFPPAAPGRIGMFVLTGERITFSGDPEVMVTHDGDPVREIEMETDKSGSPTILSTGSFRWFVIQRGERFGIRLRDLNHSNVNRLDSIPHFPVDLAWKVHATFEPFIQPVTIHVPNVQGTVEESPVPGLLKFQVGEQALLLYPMGEPDQLFLVFGDETSGLETYGGGRFLKIGSPDEKGTYIIDFNKAYNPPCAFTPFATCPLPPKENVLPIRITAGEKAVKGFGHH